MKDREIAEREPIKEIDTVMVLRDVEGTPVHKGMVGTVVYAHKSGAVLVEFNDGQTGVPIAEQWFDPSQVRIVQHYQEIPVAPSAEKK